MADIVLWTFSSAARRKELERFHTDEWLYKLEPARIELALQLKCDAVANDALVVMAQENIGSGNKSEMLRVIIILALSKIKPKGFLYVGLTLAAPTTQSKTASSAIDPPPAGSLANASANDRSSGL